MDLGSVVSRLKDEGQLRDLATNRRVQFGTKARRYLAAEFLPEVNTDENQYTETQIRYRTMVANAGSRYSPVQKKRGSLIGEFDVKLADSDIGDELTSRDYDYLLRLLQRNATMDAVSSIIRWVDNAVNRPLLETNELWRWQAIVAAQVNLRGNNKYSEDINYSDPSGHRANAGGTWTNNSYDPFTDIFAMVQLLANKGYTVNRIVTSRRVVNIMANNTKVQTRAGHIRVSAATGAFAVVGGRASLAQINASLSEDGLPPIEIYDELYRTQTGTGRFLADTVMVLIATTGRDQTIDLGDTSSTLVLPNTLGYTAIGRPAGQSDAGRVILANHKEDKPPRIEAQSWQTSLPVITEPEAIAVIKAIA